LNTLLWRGQHTRKITAGVPHGSVLGPTLWNITYDWVLRTPLEEGCVILGYADDTLILSKANTTEEAIAKANLQNSRTLRRVERLGLKIAESKTGVIIFNANTNIYNAMYKVRVNREEIAICTSIKYLGLLLDKNWKFTEHFDYIEEKVSRVIRALSSLMPNLKGPRERKGCMRTRLAQLSIMELLSGVQLLPIGRYATNYGVANERWPYAS